MSTRSWSGRATKPPPPRFTAAAIRADLAPALHAAGAPCEHVEFWDISAGGPALEEYRRSGQRPDPDMVMVLDRLALPGRGGSVQTLEVARPDRSFWDWYRESLHEFGTAKSEDLLDQMTDRTAEVFVPAGLRFYVGLLDGQRVGYTSLLSLERVGYLDNVVTMPSFRLRGVATATVTATVLARPEGLPHSIGMAPTEDGTRDAVERALREDSPSGDVTTSSVVPETARCRAELRAKAEGVLAGTGTAQAAFEIVAAEDRLGAVEVSWKVRDGDAVRSGDTLAVVEGPARSVLRAERVAINFLGHLSGVATLTRRFVEAARPAEVLCTRKTTPGLRSLEREAVAAGGGSLHRASLSDAVLIKDNHLRVAGSVREAVRAARHGGVPVEVEVETLDELEEALAAGADRILLDNPSPELVGEAVTRVGDPRRLEVSGGITLDSVPLLVRAGARVISVGRITHSASSLDLSLEVTDVH